MDMLNYSVLVRALCDSFYSVHLELRERSQETRLPPVAEAVRIGCNCEMESHSYFIGGKLRRKLRSKHSHEAHLFHFSTAIPQ